MSELKACLKTLGKDLGQIDAIVNDTRFFGQALSVVYNSAVANAPGGDSGNLRGSIGMTVEQEPGRLTGHVGTNIEYAMYVEYGTGPKGQAHHEGTSPDITPTYHQGPWWIPASELDTDNPDALAEKYGWTTYVKDGETFYKTYGQPAKPFLYPALKDNEQMVADTLNGGWTKAIRRLK